MCIVVVLLRDLDQRAANRRPGERFHPATALASGIRNGEATFCSAERNRLRRGILQAWKKSNNCFNQTIVFGRMVEE
ncbi:hypothetical protein [Pseudomonas lopnurensis]|nr:hypothetical protein [Pseudomonas lopnurensis]MBE7375311.1 hypothetical protein [Pseudomonas lopnurensis]